MAKVPKPLGEEKLVRFAHQYNAFIGLKQFLPPNPEDISAFFFPHGKFADEEKSEIKRAYKTETILRLYS